MTSRSSVPVVEAVGVSRMFPAGSEEVWALRDASLTVHGGEFVALIGRSGSGKTTLLNLIAGLDRPTNGSVLIDGQDITTFSERQLTHLRRHTIGFVFQSFGLLPLLSAYENVEIALRIAGAGLRERRRRSDELLEMVGLSGRSKHRPYELSGGEQQRVAIARALANSPSLLLADEPTGELDSATAVKIFQLLRDLVAHEGVTIITATHDRTVMELVNRVEEMSDGRILSPEEQELLAYTTREERSHFSSELPADIRSDVAATHVQAEKPRHVVRRREIPAADAVSTGGGRRAWAEPAEPAAWADPAAESPKVVREAHIAASAVTETGGGASSWTGWAALPAPAVPAPAAPEPESPQPAKALEPPMPAPILSDSGVSAPQKTDFRPPAGRSRPDWAEQPTSDDD